MMSPSPKFGSFLIFGALSLVAVYTIAAHEHLVTSRWNFLWGEQSKAAGGTYTVVVESQWSEDHAAYACEHAARLNEQAGLNVVPVACGRNIARTQAHSFLDRMMIEITSEPNCRGVTFARYYGPDSKISSEMQAAIDRAHWDLSVDYIVGAPMQHWFLEKEKKTAIDGEAKAPSDIANKVCVIVLSRGGAVIK